MAEYRLRRDRLDWREIEGEVLALDSATSTYLSGNPSAAALWSELAGGASRERLNRLLMERFGIGAEQAATDVDRFLEDLLARGLVEETS